MRHHITKLSTYGPALGCGIKQFSAVMQSLLLLLVLSATAAVAKPAIINASDAYQMATSGEIILVDIRTPQEWAETGIGEGAIALDMTAKTFVRDLIALRDAYPDTQIAFICATGGRSGYVNRYLAKNNFRNTADVPEGMMGSRKGPGWLKTGLPTYAGNPAEIKKRLQTALSGN